MLTRARARVLSSPSRSASSSARSPRATPVRGRPRASRAARARCRRVRARPTRRAARGSRSLRLPSPARGCPRRRTSGTGTGLACNGLRPTRRPAPDRWRSHVRSPGSASSSRPTKYAAIASSSSTAACSGTGSRSTKWRRAPVVGVRLAIRLQRRRTARGDERVVGDDVLRARGFRVVDDVGRVGIRLEQRLEDLGVEAAPRRDREARPERVPCQLVAEAYVGGIDLEQPPALRLDGGAGPARHHANRAGTCSRDSGRPRRARRGGARRRRAATRVQALRSRPRAAARRWSGRRAAPSRRTGCLRLPRTRRRRRRRRARRRRPPTRVRARERRSRPRGWLPRSRAADEPAAPRRP